ncbi:hypothetical protein C9I98_04380 [Photobacterium sanctipauli]|uniref:VanZ-like domain-containing protein n=1 Tax=Photobacterium sanctipauli TaxID=1342794 RepID=A0A2T3NY31_9GAMM|nr:VanZ family protein [Photobacterium sanctipauli]PSW21195.1 hypothetical protein C9I98_04380 [Photobacterium sanctipauli]
MINHHHGLIATVIFIFYTALITHLSLIGGAQDGDIMDFDQYGILLLDKILHLGAYCCFVLIAHFIFVHLRHLLWLSLTLCGYGLLLEFIQSSYIPGREGSLLDAISNMLGVAIGFITVFFYRKLTQLTS